MPLTTGDDLDQILCWEYTRQIKNDRTIQFENNDYQIKKTGVKVQPKQQHPERWTGKTRNWTLPETVTLSPNKKHKTASMSGNKSIVKAA